MESYLKQLIAIQKQVNGLVEEIQSHMLREKIGNGPPVEMPKKRGRPPKAAVAETEAAPVEEKSKRVLTEEHKQKLKEGRERAKAVRDAEKAATALSLAASETSSVAEIAEQVAEETVVAEQVAEQVAEPAAETIADSASVASEAKPKKRLVMRKPTKPTDVDIYKYMFELQESGVCNMLGSGDYLRKRFSGMTAKEAEDIVLNYMSNYEELRAKFGQ
jgi:hypothetical protein